MINKWIITLIRHLCVCVCVFSSSLNRKQSRRRDEKLLPPLLSPLSDDPPRKRTCDSSSSLGQEGGSATGMLPCSTSSTTSASSSSHRHRRGEGKASSHVRNGSVSDRLYILQHSHRPHFWWYTPTIESQWHHLLENWVGCLTPVSKITRVNWHASFKRYEINSMTHISTDGSRVSLPVICLEPLKVTKTA